MLAKYCYRFSRNRRNPCRTREEISHGDRGDLNSGRAQPSASTHCRQARRTSRSDGAAAWRHRCAQARRPACSTVETATTIVVASVDAVRRTLGDRIILDPVETACAETYRQPADGERYLAARMLLRHSLSKAVGGQIAPGKWKYREGQFGKPVMADETPPLEFNISHSRGCVAVAVSTQQPIGVDLEYIDPTGNSEVVHDVLTEVERDRLRRHPADRQWGRFVRIWTAKEACSKALGLGLSLDFQRMEVLEDPLRVRLLDHPSGGPIFDLAATTVSRGGHTYALASARLMPKDR